MTPFTEVASDLLLKLPPDPTAPRRARRALHQARLPEDIGHTVDLLATEVVANAVRHAGLAPPQQITLAARYVEDFIRVEVHDDGPGFDVERETQGRGYGLRMVDKLATRWGVEQQTGTRVWFEVDRRSRGRFDRDPA